MQKYPLEDYGQELILYCLLIIAIFSFLQSVAARGSLKECYTPLVVTCCILQPHLSIPLTTTLVMSTSAQQILDGSQATPMLPMDPC